MRRSFKDTKCLTTDIVEGPNGPTGGQVIGINLGWDFVAEHEWGIEGLQRTFGISGKPERKRDDTGAVVKDLVGADIRTVTKVPAELKFFENLGGYAYMLCSSRFAFRWNEKDATAKHFNEMMRLFPGEKGELAAAWSGGDFGVRMKNDALKLGATVLGQIYEALEKKDAMIFLAGGGNPFSNRGLYLTIRSRVPEDTLQQMKEADEGYLNLMDAVERVEAETGLKEKLKTTGKRYFALSPCWAASITSTKDGEMKTVHPVVFFLNPMEQQQNNFGWYTVEQLLEWAEGKGPIPKVGAS
ncbi:MAG: hypothetical protein Q7S95_00410 [bacterium]|nr:hypothetical protein [bacterium]